MMNKSEIGEYKKRVVPHKYNRYLGVPKYLELLSLNNPTSEDIQQQGCDDIDQIEHYSLSYSGGIPTN